MPTLVYSQFCRVGSDRSREFLELSAGELLITMSPPSSPSLITVSLPLLHCSPSLTAHPPPCSLTAHPSSLLTLPHAPSLLTLPHAPSLLTLPHCSPCPLPQTSVATLVNHDDPEESAEVTAHPSLLTFSSHLLPHISSSASSPPPYSLPAHTHHKVGLFLHACTSSPPPPPPFPPPPPPPQTTALVRSSMLNSPLTSLTTWPSQETVFWTWSNSDVIVHDVIVGLQFVFDVLFSPVNRRANACATH